MATFIADYPDVGFGYSFWQVTLLWQRQVARALQAYELTHVQFILLAGIKHLTRLYDDVTQVQLAGYVNTDVMMTSKVLSTLEQKRLIVRMPHLTDTRAKTVKLLKAGDDMVGQTMPIVAEADRHFFKILQLNEATFQYGLRKLLQKHAMPADTTTVE